MNIFSRFLLILCFSGTLIAQSDVRINRNQISTIQTREKITNLLNRIKSGEQTLIDVVQILSADREETIPALAERIRTSFRFGKESFSLPSDAILEIGILIAMNTPESHGLLRELTSQYADPDLRGFVLNAIIRAYELAGKDEHLTPNKQIVLCFLSNINDKHLVKSLGKTIREISLDGLSMWVSSESRAALQTDGNEKKSKESNALTQNERAAGKMWWNKSAGQFSIRNLKSSADRITYSRPLRNSVSSDTTDHTFRLKKAPYPDVNLRVNR